MIEKVLKVKYSTRNGEREKQDKRFRVPQAVAELSQLCAEPGSRAGCAGALQAQPGPAGKDGDRRAGQTCWAPPASGEGRLAQGMLGVKCPPPAFCTVCGFFTCFYPFKLHLYDKPPSCERISLGKN